MPPKSDPSTTAEWVRIGETLRAFREKCGFKPDEAASKVDISRSHLMNIEAGRRPITPVLLSRFSAIYNIRPASIVKAGHFVDSDERPRAELVSQ